MSIEKKKIMVQIKKIEAAIEEMELKIQERKAEIVRIEKHIELQKKTKREFELKYNDVKE